MEIDGNRILLVLSCSALHFFPRFTEMDVSIIRPISQPKKMIDRVAEGYLVGRLGSSRLPSPCTWKSQKEEEVDQLIFAKPTRVL